MFAAWRAFQHEHHDRQRLQAEIAPIQTELRQLLEHASQQKARNRWHRPFANNLLKIWPALWTFTTIEGVQPTNNPAERSLRSPVIHCKLSLGNQSDTGERLQKSGNREKSVQIDGGGGIRTRDGLSPMPVFKTGAFNRSATPPGVDAPEATSRMAAYNGQTLGAAVHAAMTALTWLPTCANSPG